MKRVLFDENLPRLLAREFADFEVRTVPEVGWAGIKNGKLLRLAEAEFDVFLTADNFGPGVTRLTIRSNSRQLTRVGLRACTTFRLPR